MSVSISGGEGFEHFIDAQIKIGEEVIAVVKTNGAEMQQRAQTLAPVDTGFLKRNIYLDFSLEGLNYKAQISGEANYDAYQEYGTRYMPGKPHIRPAFFYQRFQFIKDVRKLVNK